MPFDFAERKKKRDDAQEAQRIYVCECGDICVETKHTRMSFSPEEFIGLLRAISMKDKSGILPIIQKFGDVKRLCTLVLIAAGFLFMTACAPASAVKTDNNAERIVAVGGSLTEIVYALDAGEKLVGTDTSSIFPEAATKLPQVGYQRQLSAEGVLSLKPSLVMVLPEAGPPAAIRQIESAGVKVLRVGNESTIEGTKAKIRQIAEALNRQEKGEQIIKSLENDLTETEKIVATKSAKPKIVFIYSRGAGAAQVGGTGTPADAMIKMAGGMNAINEFADYKPLTPEALVAAAPDVILLPARSLAGIGGIEGVLSLPGVAETPDALSTLPKRMSKKQIVRLLKERYRTERAYQELKGELGLAHFEGRRFRGWHHHVTVALCCYAFVIAERVRHFPPSLARSAGTRTLQIAA